MIDMDALKTRFLNVLIALDQLAWVLVTLGNGYPDETISAAAWRMEQRGGIAGRVSIAIVKCASRWASLPGAGYGQHEHKISDLEAVFVAAGGRIA